MSRIDAFIKFMIEDLEGYSDKHPCNQNKGETHPTCYGFYTKFHVAPKSMTEAIEMYKEDWFVPLTGVEDLDLFILQFSVNVGEARALKLVKTLRFKKEQDLEPITLADLARLQQDYYDSLPAKFDLFQRGWKNRIQKTIQWLNA